MNLKDAVRTLLFKDKVQGENNQLITRWGRELDPGNVLTEYPRPQLRRDRYVTLNGYWDYDITKEGRKPDRFDGRIIVPFSPESILSGVSRQLKPDEFLWYQRALPVEHRLPGKRLLLHFGAVDQSCEIYINDQKVAEHTGGYLPFSIDITGDIEEGENILTLKVVDVSDTSYHSRGKQTLNRGGMFYTAQSGIWQTVWYEWVPEYYIESLKLTPDTAKGEIHIQVNMNHRHGGGNLYQAVILEHGRILQTISSEKPAFTVKLENFRYWSPEDPFLYDLAITVGKDRVESYFAMRNFSIGPDKNGRLRIFLNGKPYFQNGLLDQGYWPDGLYTPPSDEAMIYDITMAKSLGFNMLRKHIKIEPLRWYYHCDRLGVIVWQDMVNGGDAYSLFVVNYLPTILPKLAARISDKHYGLLGRSSEQGRREWSMECKETVELLYNCPCIACWVPFNEGWGQFDAKEAYKRIKELDATRLIDHASGWFDQRIGDFESIHNYFHPLKVHRRKRPVIFSEIGGYACYIKNHSFSWKIYGYKVFKNTEEFDTAFQKLYREELRRLVRSGLSAVVYTQLTDVEDEVNGLLTYDREICKVESLKDMKWRI